MTSEIRLATLNEYTEISAFIDQYWKKNHVYTRDKALFDWTFRDAPLWGEPAYSVSIAIDGTKIIGMLGIIPFQLNVYGESHKACWLVNWLVIPEARKGRMGLGLLDLFSKTQGYNTISFGINDTVARLYAALKWQHMPPMPRMEWINPTRIRDAEEFLVTANPAVTIDQIRQYISQHSAIKKSKTSLQANSLDVIESAEWDNSGWSGWSHRIIGCTRDFSYLNWRYIQHPIYRYETRIIADGKSLGLIVWRLEMTKKTKSAGKMDNYFSFARIVEFLPVSERNAHDLMATFLADIIAAGAIAADFYCYNAELSKILRQIGFSMSAGTTDVSLPNYTQPVAPGGVIRSAIKVVSDDRARADAPCWYWTRSDSDQDRPN